MKLSCHRKEFSFFEPTVSSMVALFVLLTILSSTVFAKSPSVEKRTVGFDWEPIPGATRYELELTSIKSSGKRAVPRLFKVKKSTWSAKILPGKYEIRLRSFDHRDVPGDWGEPMPLAVLLPSPEMVSPSQDLKIPASSSEKTSVRFEWKAVKGAHGYIVEILSPENNNPLSKTTSETFLELELLPNAKYKWRVLSSGPEDERGEEKEFDTQFAVLGKKLEKPSIFKPDPEKPLDHLAWSRPENSKSFDFTLSVKKSEKDWQIISAKNGISLSEIPLKSVIPKGSYKLSVRANAVDFPSSDFESMEFVVGANRKPSAVEESQLKVDWTKTKSFYLIASYLVTNLKYQGTTKELNTGSTFDAFGGTGRVGIGYQRPNSAWGASAIGEYSGFTIGGQIYNFAASELNGSWEKGFGKFQFQINGGGFYRELPSLVSNRNTGAFEQKKVATLGPQSGLRIFYPLSTRLGLQLNSKAYLSLIKFATPNGEDIKSTVSYQYGLLGSYRISPNSTGYIGYAYRNDNITYKAQDSVSHPTTSFALPGSDNTVTITGHYLNLLLEWGF